jgi:hypothetical protein
MNALSLPGTSTRRSSGRIGRLAAVLGTAGLLLLTAIPVSYAGSVFLTGHDPDFHAFLGANAVGAANINRAAINFIRDPGFNTFVGIAPKFLFVESSIAPPPGHVVGKSGIIASGYVEGVDFDHHDASTLVAALALLGVPGGYSAIVVASDFGGVLTQAELDILNGNQSAIAGFVNAGGGIYAMAESNSGAHLTPGGGHYAFIPTIVSAVNVDQGESGFTVTPFGASLGLTNADINGNASHAVFTGINGFTVVDTDASGRILSIAGREQVVPVGQSTWGKIKALYR